MAAPIPPTDPRAAVAAAEPIVVRQIYLHAVQHGARERADALLHGLGLAAPDLERPDFRVSYAQTCQVVRRALHGPAAGTLALRLGIGFNPVCWGLALVGMMASTTLHDLLRFGAEFAPSVRGLLALRWQTADEDLVIAAEPLYDDDTVNAFLVEHAFASLVRVARFAVGARFAPRSVAFHHRADAAAAAALLGCPATAGHAADLLVLAPDGQPVPTAEPVVARMCRRLLTLQPPAPGGRSALADAVLLAAGDDLRDVPAAQRLASRLGIGERTLRRRLAAEGTTYAALVDLARRRAVTLMLRDGRRSLQQVAAAGGFADVRSLRRAFRRWTGRTLAQARGGGGERTSG